MLALAPQDSVKIKQFCRAIGRMRKFAMSEPSLSRKGAYRAEKARVLAETVHALEEHFPGLAERVEASDVATPTTCERYTDNWRGCMQARALTPALWKRYTSGRMAIKNICRQRGSPLPVR